MITLPSGLDNFMKGQNLDGLKPFAFLFRNKWDSVNEKYSLDTTPIDISELIVKPNTLSMTLDVNEVAQYNANNVTLTLSDTKNYFVEGTPNSYFPDGYQLYGSRVVLYYGTDSTNRTPLFTGVIKDLPTHKPEQYQVELKLVSPLEMLKDIEAKDFSDKVTGEELHYEHQDADSHRIYSTAGTGVGGFDAVYADGNKLFEGVDYEVEQTNALGLPALVTIINDDLQNATIIADYYTWKTNLTVEQVIAGVVALAGYNSSNTDIRNVIWNTEVKSEVVPTVSFSVGYKQNPSGFSYVSSVYFGYDPLPPGTTAYRYSKFPTNFRYEIVLYYNNAFSNGYYGFGNIQNGAVYNGYIFRTQYGNPHQIQVIKVQNGSESTLTTLSLSSGFLNIYKNGTIFTFTTNLSTYSDSFDFQFSSDYTEIVHRAIYTGDILQSATLWDTDTMEYIQAEGVVFEPLNYANTTWGAINGTLVGTRPPNFQLLYKTTTGGTVYPDGTLIDFGSEIGVTSSLLRITIFSAGVGMGSSIEDFSVDFLSSYLTLQLVNLSGKTVLEALQDFALISGYEFGVDRNGVLFFRPRVSSTTPTYILDHDEIVKVDTIKKNLSDFFTKLTLTFAQVPLEFYANSGPRPNLVDKYGVINKEIDKPDIVNYDNPELAQAIGPQLLEVYSALPNVIQVTGKLNLSLELSDIVSLRRNMNLITPEGYSDYSKYTDLNTYYRACKITGMNYNFAKKQITYTLRDVSNKNTEPQYEFNEYIYDYQVQFGVKE